MLKSSLFTLASLTLIQTSAFADHSVFCKTETLPGELTSSVAVTLEGSHVLQDDPFNPVSLDGLVEITGPRTFVKYNTEFSASRMYKRLGYIENYKTTIPHGPKIVISEDSLRNEGPVTSAYGRLILNPGTAAERTIFLTCELGD